jgi:hypothetical protein
LAVPLVRPPAGNDLCHVSKICHFKRFNNNIQLLIILLAPFVELQLITDLRQPNLRQENPFLSYKKCMKRVKSQKARVHFFFTIAFMISTMKPKQWRLHNLLSKLSFVHLSFRFSKNGYFSFDTYLRV